MAALLLVETVGLALGVPFVFVKKAAGAGLCAAFAVAGVICLSLVRRGRIRLGCWVILSVGWALVAAGAVFAHGVSGIVPICFVVISVAAGWLLGRRAVLLFSGLSCVSATAMAVVETAGGGLPSYFPMPPVTSWLLFVLAMMLVSVPYLEVLGALGNARAVNEQRRLQFGATAEARQRDVLAASRDAKILADIDTGMIVYANPAAEALCGRSLAELRLLHHTQLYPPEKATAAQAGFAADAGVPGLSEGRIQHKDGRLIPVEIVSSHFTGSDGRTLLLGIFRDVTERNAARDALRQSEERFRQVAENAGEFIWEVDANGLCTYASPVVEEIFGYTPEEVTGRMHFYDFFVPETREEVKQAAFEAFARRERFHAFPHWNVRKDGRRVLIESSGAPVDDGNGNFLGYRGADMDVTERRRTEAALQEHEALLRAITESTPDPIFVKDRNGRLLLANPATLAILQKRAEEVLGRTDEEIYDDPDVGRRMMANDRRVMESGQTHVIEEVVPGSNGPRTFLSAKMPYRDAEGRVIGVIGVARDITERQQAEAVLRESEERFRSLADTAPVMIWAAGPDRLCTFFNRPWLDFTGRTMEQERGNGWTSGVYPEDLDRCLATYTSSFDDRRGFQMEYRLRRADGEYRWVLDNGTPLWREGEFAGFIGSCVDVTGQKRVEEQLRASEIRHKDAQRLAKVGSWERLDETDEIRWSDEMFRIYGLSHENPRNLQALLTYVHPNDRGRLLEADHRIRSGNAPVEMEYRIVRPDGEVRFVRASAEAIRNDQGRVIRVVGATQDVTEQVKTRESLRESENRLKDAERIAHVGHWQRDIKAGLVSWSEETFRIFGKPRDWTPTYEGFLDAVIPEDRARVGGAIQDCLKKKTGHSIETRIVRPNGDLRTVVCTTEVLLDEDGSPAHVFGACQDITESRSALEEAFERQKLESVGTLASGIAHDFNNLLGAVVAEADLALTQLAAGADAGGELKRIRGVAIHGSEIVRELMIFAGNESAVPGPVDLSQIVEEMLGLLKVTLSKHATLVTDLGKGLPAVRASSAQLRQIVMNLVTNASEAMGDRNGEIQVTTRRIPADQAKAISERLPEGDYLQLEVSDTGRGMPLETRSRVFDPFFTTKSAGRGLGLAVVSGIVRDLHGAIRLASEPGKGTTFQILLPCDETPARTTSGPASEGGNPVALTQETTVLVVEDEDALRQPVAKMLRQKGLSVVEAGDGTRALEVIRTCESPIDVLFLDITLPGATSREVLQEAKSLRPGIRVIVTSAYSADVAAVELQAKVDRFLRKPYRLTDLVDQVKRALA